MIIQAMTAVIKDGKFKEKSKCMIKTPPIFKSNKEYYTNKWS
jgi:hypothetical protein